MPEVGLITGATAGIGEATASLLARLGATVVGIGRNPTKNENSTRKIKERSSHPNVIIFRPSWVHQHVDQYGPKDDT